MMLIRIMFFKPSKKYEPLSDEELHEIREEVFQEYVSKDKLM
jgi:hypothetical protein